MAGRRCLWLAAAVALLAACGGRGKPTLAPPREDPAAEVGSPPARASEPASKDARRAPAPEAEPRSEPPAREPLPRTAEPPPLDEQTEPSPPAPLVTESGRDYDLAPIPIRITEPEHPAAARERGVSGTVLVEFVIDESGRVASARVLQSVPELDAAALACVRSWLFKPALRDGKSVATTARTPVRFSAGGVER